MSIQSLEQDLNIIEGRIADLLRQRALLVEQIQEAKETKLALQWEAVEERRANG